MMLARTAMPLAIALQPARHDDLAIVSTAPLEAGFPGDNTSLLVEGAWASASAGEIDESFLTLATVVARNACQTRPSPTGAPTWSDGEIHDLVYDTIVRVTPAAIVLAANEASSAISFRAWLGKAMRTTLDLRARKTPSGRVIRAVDDALSGDPDRFVHRNGHWQLVGDDREPEWSEGIDRLVDEAWTVATRTVHLTDALKTPPMAYRQDIREVCAAILKLSGPLRKDQLSEIAAYRFNVAFETTFDYIHAGESDDADSEPLAPGTRELEDAVDDEAAAAWVFGQLTAGEREVAALVAGGCSLRDLASALGCTKYQADLLHSRLRAKLQRLDDIMGGAVSGATGALARLVGQERELRHLVDGDGQFDAD